jgi:hypothetical protein
MSFFSIKQNTSYLDKYFDSPWRFYDGDIYNSRGTKIGINKNNPNFPLDVSGSMKATSILDISNSIGLYNQVLSSTGSSLRWQSVFDISGIRPPTGNTLFVDSVYGDDTLGPLNPNSQPFKTISAALLSALPGNIVLVNAGTYNETLTIPDNVSLSGAGAQAVVIQKLNVTQDTTLITVGVNCRVENFTANLSSSGNYNLTGIKFLSTSPSTSISSKLRNSIWTITSTASGSPTIIAAESSGTSSTTYSPANMIQRTTLNVISSGSGISRGIYVNGPNRFSVRDIVIYARGTGTNIIGAEITNASGVLEIKTSSIGGVLYDVNRAAGTMIIGATDLLTNNANGNSFTPTQAPASFQFGIIGSLGNDQRYYLIPGTATVNTLTNESKSNSFSSAKAFPIVFTQPSLVIEVNISYKEVTTLTQTITFFLYKNDIAPPVFSLTLNPGENLRYVTDKSITFNQGDTLTATLETTGNPSGSSYPAFNAIVGYY